MIPRTTHKIVALTPRTNQVKKNIAIPNKLPKKPSHKVFKHLSTPIIKM